MAQTEAQKNAFSDWMLDLLKNPENRLAIEAAKPGVTFDTAGNVTLLTGKLTAQEGKEGKIVSLQGQLKTANADANTAMNDRYTASSSSAEAVVGHCGKDHPLSHLIRNKRDSMDHASPTPPTP